MNRAELFLRRHSSTILTILGSTGVIATSVLAVKATPKALQILKTAREEKGDDLTSFEMVKYGWKPYIPAAISGVSTIVCIFGINCLSVKNQASLMSAYALLDNSYREYRDKIHDICGKETDNNAIHDIVRSKFDDEMELHSDKLLFYDYQSKHFFESTMEDVMRAENEFLETFHRRGHACINEYYNILGIPYVDYGYQLGWYDYESNDPYNCKELTFDYEEITINGNQKCWLITMSMPPSFDYII